MGEVVACGMEEVVVGRVDMKEFTLLEKVLVQILIASSDNQTSGEHICRVLQRAGLTKQQARKALGWGEDYHREADHRTRA